MNNSERLKDKKIKTLESQIKLLQERQLEAYEQIKLTNQLINDFRNRFAFYRSAIEKGLEVKDMFLEEIPFSMQIDYEIANYKHIVDQIKRRSKLIGWVAERTIDRIIEDLENTKNEVSALQKKSEQNKNKNLKIVE